MFILEHDDLTTVVFNDIPSNMRSKLSTLIEAADLHRIGYAQYFKRGVNVERENQNKELLEMTINHAQSTTLAEILPMLKIRYNQLKAWLRYDVEERIWPDKFFIGCDEDEEEVKEMKEDWEGAISDACELLEKEFGFKCPLIFDFSDFPTILEGNKDEMSNIILNPSTSFKVEQNFMFSRTKSMPPVSGRELPSTSIVAPLTRQSSPVNLTVSSADATASGALMMDDDDKEMMASSDDDDMI